MATLKAKLALLRGLIDGERAYIGPAWVALDVTRRCNNVCLGCFFHCIQPRGTAPGDSTIKDLPLELAQKLSRELADLHTPEVVLVGEGEPLLHPQIFDIISSFRQAGITVQCFTNGSLLDEAMIRRLVSEGPDTLNVTFWAVNPTEHARWHPGVSLDFLERRRRGVMSLAAAKRRANGQGPRVSIQLPLNRSNYRNIDERVELVLASGCEAMSFGFFRDWGGQFQKECLSHADADEIRESLLEAKRRFQAAGVKHNVDDYLDRAQLGGDAWRNVPCYAGWYESYVKVDGTVLTCGPCWIVMGNSLERSFAEIWNGTEYRDFRHRSASLAGLESMRESCDCANCCLWQDNRRVHRAYRWVAPLASAAGFACAGSREIE